MGLSGLNARAIELAPTRSSGNPALLRTATSTALVALKIALS